MKSTLVFCLAAAALAGCAGPVYNDQGEWLDRVSVRPARPVQHTPEELRQLNDRQQQLQAKAENVRFVMAQETRREVRIEQLRELQSIDDELRPVQRALNGGPMPYRGWPLAQPGDAGS